ncbi:MAG: hypothetical protein AAFR36_02130 [Bacteroidota bacterium]
MFLIHLPQVWQFKQLYLRDMTAKDELLVQANNSFAAIALLDQMLQGSAQADNLARQLPIAERDCLLAALYGRYFGTTISSTIKCIHCGESIDIDFSLPDMVAHQWNATQESVSWHLGEGIFQDEEGLQFRLPTGEDEIALQYVPPAQINEKLQERCLIKTPGDKLETAKLESALEKVAPLLETDLQATCPECGKDQSVYFSMQSYLLNTILQDRSNLFREIHLIASAYGWSREEIVNMGRTERKAYVAMLQKN